jgi:hypothetical protein
MRPVMRPVPLRPGESRRDSGFLSLLVLAVMVSVFIGGASFGAQKLVDRNLSAPRAGQTTNVGAATPAPFAMSLSGGTTGASSASSASTASPGTAIIASVEAGEPPATPPARPVRRGIQPRRAIAVRSVNGGSVSGELPSERGAVSASATPDWL